MSLNGQNTNDILAHYYMGAELEKIYK
jgi:peptidoglycan hydrolase-like amidase